jgi:hypothetical protein
MAEYESLHGTRVKYLSSDPTLDSSTEGQVWYNSTSGTNKALVQIKAWSSGGSLLLGRYELGGVGTQTAGLAFGGNRAVNSPTGIKTETEEYNGYNWESGGALPAAKATQGFGVQTAAVAVGGTIAPNPTAGATTEEYNGTSWTSSGALNTATVAAAASTGIESAGLRAGGGSNPSTRLNAVEEYNGSGWTSVTSLPATRFQFQGTGPQTASFFTGGNTAPGTTETTDSFNYDGTNWTAGPTMPFGIRLHSVSGNSNTANLSFGGEQAPGGRNLSVFFDGSSFTSDATLGTGRESLGGFGASKTAIACGGNNAPSYDLTNTEEYTSSINVASPGAWASANNMNVARFNFRTDVGTQTATLVAGGGDPAGNILDTSEEYDGTNWTSGGNIPTALSGMGGGGTQTAAFASGGNNPSDTRQSQTSNYNGSSWTTSGSMPFASGQGTGWGTQTAGAHVGGYTGSTWVTTTAEYDGSSWTGGGAYPVAIGYNFAVGTQTAGLSGMGLENGGTPNTNVNEYNGSSWTAGGSNNTNRHSSGAFGIQTSAIYSGGSPGTGSQGSAVEEYNGTGWTSITSTSTSAAYRMGGGANSGSGIIMGGNSSPSGSGPNNTTNVAEEWTNPSGAVTTASTLTTS